MMEKNIVLVCSAGMSTSMLVAKMKEEAQKEGLSYDIRAIGSTEALNYVKENKTDVILLGPQVRYLESTYNKELVGLDIPISVIKPQDYGTMNGKNVLDYAKTLMNVE
ncbi:PTS sugar transporter subunit IIB [Tuanshanicoccus lijuaniae]|uniref:PTS sugar transporter subunit IIB n=1 Tax=Aerococcaceae bacterium zg-1292 TaxID=2774330 RepID=UPI0019356BF4|nr:PTS sugar transporter subunit IIB [Aerococcaceae bacterium zg-1292]QQA38183.1 PTS sugar transporter subunit IIB [Aerococcaceae bacterium zg-1292]